MSIKNWWRKLTGKPESREGARPQGYILDEMPRPVPRREPAPKQDLEAEIARGRERRVSQARTRAPQTPSRSRRSGSTYDSTDFGGYVSYGSSYDSTPSSSGSDCGGSSYGGSSSSSYDSGGSSSSCDSGGSY